MIECPFCNESFEEENLVFEFNWGEVATYYYNRKKLTEEPNRDYKDRAFYVTFKYDLRGRPMLNTCAASINPKKHPGLDPMCSDRNGWGKVVYQLRQKKVFEVECDDDDESLPVAAKILPLLKERKKNSKRGHVNRLVEAEGMSTGIYCPICEQQLRAEVLKAQTEVRILLAGRPGSGKTVYVTQAISELMLGHLTEDFSIEAANQAVHEHYINNKNRLKVAGNGFVLATNPGSVQEPYVYLMKNDKSTVRLVIQDIAGEDTKNHIKYSTAVRKADMVLFFIDPWHIEEIRLFHEKNQDACNDIVNRTVKGQFADLGGVFNEMMRVVDKKFAEESGQMAGVLLVKGDYLNPPMLSQGEQPECQMMSMPLPFNKPEAMEFEISMRSSFIRQLMHEWESTRSFSREVESKYSAHNTRYFVSSSLGQSTHLQHVKSDNKLDDRIDVLDPDAQFSISGASASSGDAADDWEYGEQVLESPAHPEHVIDPIFWCLHRKGVKF